MVSFIIHNVKPCSINAGYYKTKKVLTLEGRRYRKRLLLTINRNKEIKKQLEAFRKSFNPEKHAVSLTYYFMIPHSKMYTKKGMVSMASGDTDNYFKLTTDFLFNPKYMGHTFPKVTDYLAPIENFGVDDRFIVHTQGYKAPNENDYYSVGIKAKIVSKLPSSLPKFKQSQEYQDL